MSTNTEDKEPLTVRAWKATRGGHEVSNIIVVAKLAVVLTDRATYGKALSCFLPVYTAMEEKVLRLAKTHSELALVAPVVTELNRRALMEKDLAFLLGPEWKTQVVRTPAVDNYVKHLDDLEREDPRLLIVYAYSMHIPMLLGPIKKVVRRTLNLERDGLAFMDIETDQYRNQLLKKLKDAVNLAGSEFSEEFIQKYINETSKMYSMNNTVVQSFSTGYWASVKALPSLVLTLVQTAVPYREVTIPIFAVGAASLCYYWLNSARRQA